MNPTCVNGVELKNYLLNKTPDEFTIAEFWGTTIQKLLTLGRLGGANVYKQSKTAIEKHADLNIPFNKFTYHDLLNLEQQLYLSRLLMDQD